nr:hypothetical protein [Paenibacillus alkaliterrae]
MGTLPCPLQTVQDFPRNAWMYRAIRMSRAIGPVPKMPPTIKMTGVKTRIVIQIVAFFLTFRLPLQTRQICSVVCLVTGTGTGRAGCEIWAGTVACWFTAVPQLVQNFD